MGKSKNRILRLKCFTVRDDQCAMKVGTDALVLGAWAQLPPAGRPVLDIGTGCGILALMAAQRAPDSQIVAVEVDPAAAAQAAENVRTSPWASQIAVHQRDFLEFVQLGPYRSVFGAIWVNPPYFREKPTSPDPARTRARHESALPLVDWLPACTKVLGEEGSLSVVWPVERERELVEVADSAGFVLTRRLYIRGRSERPVIRLAATFIQGQGPAHPTTEEVTVETGLREDGTPRRGEAYTALLEPFVLEV